MAKKDSDELDLSKQLEQMAASRRGRDLGRNVAKDIIDGLSDELDSQLPRVMENLDITQSRNIGSTVSSPNAALESRRKAAQRDNQVIKEIVRIEDDSNEKIEELIATEKEKAANLRKLAEVKKTVDQGFFTKSGTFVRTGGAITKTVPAQADMPSVSRMYGKDIGARNQPGSQLFTKEGIVRSSLPSSESFGGPTKEWAAAVAQTRAFWFKGALSSVFQRGAIDLAKLKPGMTSASAPRLAGTAGDLKRIFDELSNDPTAQYNLRQIANQYAEGHILGSLHSFRKFLGARGYNVNQLMPMSSLARHAEFLGMGPKPGSAAYHGPARATTPTPTSEDFAAMAGPGAAPSNLYENLKEKVKFLADMERGEFFPKGEPSRDFSNWGTLPKSMSNKVADIKKRLSDMSIGEYQQHLLTNPHLAIGRDLYSLLTEHPSRREDRLAGKVGVHDIATPKHTLDLMGSFNAPNAEYASQFGKESHWRRWNIGSGVLPKDDIQKTYVTFKNIADITTENLSKIFKTLETSGASGQLKLLKQNVASRADQVVIHGGDFSKQLSAALGDKVIVSTGVDKQGKSSSQVVEDQLYNKLQSLGADPSNKYRDVSTTFHNISKVSDQLQGMMQQHAANVLVKAQRTVAPLMTAENVNMPAGFEEPEFINAAMNKALHGGSVRSVPGSSITAPFGTSLASGIGGPIRPPGPAGLAALAAQLKQSTAPVMQQAAANMAPVAKATGNAFMGAPTLPGAAGFRAFYGGNVFTSSVAFEQAKQADIQKAISKQYERISTITGASTADSILIHSRLKDILDGVTTTGRFLKKVPKGLQLTGDQLERAANEVRTKWLKGQPPSVQAAAGMGGASPDILAGTNFSKLDQLFGKRYRINVAANTAAALDEALRVGAGAPGYQRGKADISQSGAGIPGVVGSARGTITGVVKSKADLARVLGIHQQIAGSQDIDDQKTTIHLMDERLSLQSSLNVVADKLNKIQMATVRAQMSMLGIYFSMLSVINMIGRAWGSVTGQLGNLNNMFKSLVQGVAFGGQFTKAQGFLKGMLGDTNNLVSAWKNYTGLMGIFNSMLTYIAYKVFTNQVLMRQIDNVIANIVELINDPTFIPSVIDLFAVVIKNLPDIINGVQTIIGVLRTVSEMPGFDFLTSGFLQTAIYAAILMPVLANLGAVFSILSWVISGVAWALGVDLPAAWAAMVASFKIGWLSTFLTTGFLGLAATILLIFTALAVGMWIALKTGLVQMVVELSDWIKTTSPTIQNLLYLFLAPFTALGSLLIDVVTGQFEDIPKDLAAVVANAVNAAISLVSKIPIIGPAIKNALSGITDMNDYLIANASKQLTTIANKGDVKTTQSIIDDMYTQLGYTKDRSGNWVAPSMNTPTTGYTPAQSTNTNVSNVFNQQINVKNAEELGNLIKQLQATQYGYTGSASK